MYLIERDQELNNNILGKILRKFTTQDRPILQKYLDYYNGKQAITAKYYSDDSKPCNRIVVNYCHSIVDNFLGYIAGKPIGYANDNFEEVLQVLKYNDYVTEDSEWLRQALIYGVAYECCYIDSDGKTRFRQFDPRECIPIYDNTLSNDLLYVVRFYKEELYKDTEKNDTFIVEVYGTDSVKRYKTNSNFGSFALFEDTIHYFKQVPVTVFSLNKDEKSIYDQIISLQDAYNSLVSASVDDVDAFADAYLILKGCTADSEDLDEMKRNRCIILDSDCDVSFLTKTISDTQIQNQLININSQIHKIANSPDLNDPNFAGQTGVAMRMKLCGMENTASNIEAEMKKALVKRIELISEILKLSNQELIWADLDIVFTRNLPFDLESTVNVVNALRGVVSTKTLLSLLPFIKDPDEEIKLVEEEKAANMEMYGLGHDEDEEELEVPKSVQGKLLDE